MKVRIKIVRIVEMLGIMLLLCGCSSAKGLFFTNADQTISKIVYSNPTILQRSPSFIANKDKQSVVMEFMGKEWYEARLVSSAELDSVLEGYQLVATSQNMMAYYQETENLTNPPSLDIMGSYHFYYVLKLDGTEDSVVLFSSYADPTEKGYATDFNVSVQYYVDEQETVPDLNFEMQESFMNQGDAL